MRAAKGTRPLAQRSLGSSGGRSVWSLAGPLATLLLWWAVARLRLVNPLLLPSPERVILAAQDIGPRILVHVVATLLRILTGFVLGCTIGVSVGVVMQYSRRAYVLLDGIIETFRPVPPVAAVPFFILIFGFSELGKVVIVTMGVSLVMAVTTVEAFERVPLGIMRWGLISGLDRRVLFRRVLLPAAIPEMRGGVRISLALAITLVIVSEFLGATAGVGYLISVAKVTLTTPTLLLAMFVLGWLGWFLDRVTRFLFNHWTAWDSRAGGALL